MAAASPPQLVSKQSLYLSFGVVGTLLVATGFAAFNASSALNELKHMSGAVNRIEQHLSALDKRADTFALAQALQKEKTDAQAKRIESLESRLSTLEKQARGR